MILGKMELKKKGSELDQHGYCFVIPKQMIELGILKPGVVYELEVKEVFKNKAWDDF